METKIIILGSGTCNLDSNCAASSVLIEHGGNRLVYDLGRGVATRLADVGLKQDDVTSIFISHFHPDHITDLLPYLHAASWSQVDQRSRDLHIYGPTGIKEVIQNILALFGIEELQRNAQVIVHEVEDTKGTIGGIELEVVDLHHSRGLRIGDIAIAGDSDLHTDLIHHIKDARIAIIDAGHITDEEIISLAVQSKAQTIICSHQYRQLDGNQLNDRAQKDGYKGKLIVAHDLMQLS